jgi:hypothetical protein
MYIHIQLLINPTEMTLVAQQLIRSAYR